MKPQCFITNPILLLDDGHVISFEPRKVKISRKPIICYIELLLSCYITLYSIVRQNLRRRQNLKDTRHESVDTGQRISSLRQVAIEILSGKRHMTWVLAVLLFSVGFHYLLLYSNFYKPRSSTKLSVLVNS